MSRKGSGMRKFLAALVCAATVAAVAVSTASADTTFECNGFYSDTTLNGPVVVNAFDFCDLEHVTVNDGLIVNGGGEFAFLLVNNSRINGGWSITNNVVPLSYFCGNNVNGGLSVTDNELFGSPLSFGELNGGCAGGRINGGVTISNNDGSVEIDGYRVNGDLNFSGIAGPLNELEATAVHGSATCQNVVDDGTSSPLVNSYTGANNGCPA
jgi:hypothetical protein